MENGYLKKELERKGVDLLDLAQSLSITEEELIDKIDGKESFTKSEMMKIYNYLKERAIENSYIYFESLFNQKESIK